jgi:hypothetical protein
MPTINGCAVLLAQMANPGVFEILVIMLTIVDDWQSGCVLGASVSTTKPIDRPRLTVVQKNRRAVHVLATDDDKGICAPLRWILEAEGYAIP